jgi:hypothetical protein
MKGGSKRNFSSLDASFTFATGFEENFMRQQKGIFAAQIS